MSESTKNRLTWIGLRAIEVTALVAVSCVILFPDESVGERAMTAISVGIWLVVYYMKGSEAGVIQERSRKGGVRNRTLEMRLVTMEEDMLILAKSNLQVTTRMNSLLEALAADRDGGRVEKEKEDHAES